MTAVVAGIAFLLGCLLGGCAMYLREHKEEDTRARWKEIEDWEADWNDILGW